MRKRGGINEGKEKGIRKGSGMDEGREKRTQGEEEKKRKENRNVTKARRKFQEKM